MNSAERLFLKQGVAVTTIEQITSGADVAKGTFYLHFSSRDEMLEALRDRFVQRLAEKIQVAVGEQDEWERKLAVWCRSCANGYLDAARLHHIVFHEVSPPTQKGLTNNIIINDLTALLAAGRVARAGAGDDPRFMAVFLFSAFHGVIVDAMTQEKRVNREKLIRELEIQCFRAVGRDKARR